MRIDGSQNIPALLQSLKVDRSTSSRSEEGRGDNSSVSLSSFAETLQSLQRQASQTTQDRGSRVEQLRQQSQNGTLGVDLDRLAARLVDLQVINFGR